MARKRRANPAEGALPTSQPPPSQPPPSQPPTSQPPPSQPPPSQPPTSQPPTSQPPPLQRRFAACAYWFRNHRNTFISLGFVLVLVSICSAMKMLGMLPDILSNSIGSAVMDNGGKNGHWLPPRGTVLRFVPSDRVRRLVEQGALDRRRLEGHRGLRRPRLALVAGNLTKDPKSLMILTVVKSLVDLGYSLEVFTLDNQEKDHSLWESVGCKVSTLAPKNSHSVIWSNYAGVLLTSLEGKRVISRLLVEPFVSVPLIWLIQEDILANRLMIYDNLGWQDLNSDWRTAFSRADVIVFSDFTLPILHSSLDTGNYFVIPEYPVNIWATESFIKSHSRNMLREAYGFIENDLVILVFGSSFFYNQIPSDYVDAINELSPLLALAKAEKTTDLSGMPKFILLFGESTDKYTHAIQTLASDMGLPDGSLLRFGLDHDVKKLLLMADIALYASFVEEQSFPQLLLQAMSFEIPIVAPDLTIITKYVNNGRHGFFFKPSDLKSLSRAFSILIEDNKPSVLAQYVASQGRLLSIDMLATTCITSYAKLLENVLQFPSDVILPDSTSQIQQTTWSWDLFNKETEVMFSSKKSEGPSCNNNSEECLSIVYLLEEQFKQNLIKRYSPIQNESLREDFPTQSDFDDINQMEDYEELARLEKEELDERMDRISGSWQKVRRNVRRAKAHINETKEHDERELEIGKFFCIYEIYSGEGAWQYLHKGSLYRGISLLRKGIRSSTDDIDAVDRLPLLNNTFYRDLLCELGAMFSVANRIDSIHKFPWIGFQSWRAAGEKVSLSVRAAKVLEDTIERGYPGDEIYFWAAMKMETYANVSTNAEFWFTCDLLNAAQCRPVFQDAFRHMYGLESDIEALPPMPSDGDKWSTLHSWVMPTHSFLEFVMFSRMFVDSLDTLSRKRDSSAYCLLGSSTLEKRHCYCRLLEMLVNVWAYHSGRKMVYLDPLTGELEEQHPLQLRVMRAKFFQYNLLKKMDEDLAEEADDQMHESGEWLWPLTGEVHWQGISDRERKERYMLKMDRKRRIRERLLHRHEYGYKQKPLDLEDNEEL